MLQQPNHSNQQQQQQQQRAYPLPPKLNRPASVLLEPSAAYHAQEKVTRPRSQSQAVYSTYVPPPNISQSSSGNSNGNSSNSNSSSSTNSGLEPGSGNDIQPRLQNWRPPTHKSKLSKQYTPSEDSDEESTGEKAAARRRSKYMSGAALELNTGPRKEETRPRTQSNASQTSVLDDTDAVSLNSLRSATKKLSLGKRISSFFRGSTNNTGKPSNSFPVSSLTQSLSNGAAAASAEAEVSANSRSSTPSLTPIDELTPPDRAHSVYIHQRSHSTPDHVGSTGYGHFNSSTQPGSQNSTIEDSRLRTARDSGFEEASGRGHRRHSSSIVKGPPAHGTSSPQLQPYQASLENQRRSSHHHKNEGVSIDSQQQHQHQQIRRPTAHLQLSSSSPQLPSHVDNELHLPTPQRHNNRHSFMGTDITNYPSSNASTPKRGNTPTGFASSSSSDTLISKVNREKASVCFQAPSAKKETFTRDAHLDPALSSLVQQHRKDFKTNQRLGGTPQLTPQRHSPQLSGHSPRQRGSLYLQDDSHQVLPPPMLTPGSRRDSNGSQNYVHPSSSPGLYAADTQTRRLSTGNQYLQQQHPNYPYTGTHGSSSSATAKPSGSQGNLSLQHPVGLHYDQALQISPLAGPQKTSSPKRLSTVGYFTPQPQPPLLQISPFPSPSLGALPTTGSLPEMTTLQPTLQQQQHLEQLQQIRIQQQQVLLQQQQHLHLQAQQARAALTVTAAAALQQQQQLQQQQLQQQQLQQQQQQLAQVGLGLDMMPAQTLGAMAMTAASPGAVSPLALYPAAFQTPHTVTMHQYQQQQRSMKLNTNNNILHGTAPMQTYPAGTGYN
ncbi:hypothetical protein BGZ88_001296 [Linnemannia elongata]|nr:hypothetical protein BGZ88_001296 [Linnemannia elongata]